MSIELRKYRSPGGRVVVELLHDGAPIERSEYDPKNDKDRKRAAEVLHSKAPALSVDEIDAELHAIDPARLELLDERGMVWRAPDGLPDPLPMVMPYSSDLMPTSVGAAIDDIAERMQCPPDFPAAAMLVASCAVCACVRASV